MLMRTLNDLVRDGKVHYLAASSMAAWKLTRALWQSDVQRLERFEVTQPRFNAADWPEDYLDICADQDLAVCPYSPLDGGFLTGKYDRDDTAPEGSRGDLNDWDGFTDRQWRVVADAAYGLGLYDAAPGPFRTLAVKHLVDPADPDLLDERQERLLVLKVLQARSWGDVMELLAFHSHGQTMRALGRTFQPLVDVYGSETAHEQRERFVGDEQSERSGGDGGTS
jgi:hypothetical protein